MTEFPKRIGHIISVEVQPDPQNAEVYGLMIEAKPIDEPVGYGIPRGDRKFFEFDDARLRKIFTSITKPDFRSHHDLLGVEVELVYANDGEKLSSKNLIDIVVTGGARRYLETDTERQSREKRQGINKVGDDGMRSRRFYACRAREENREVIEALPIPEARKNELLNLNIVLTRMVLAENDGQLSVQKLQVF